MVHAVIGRLSSRNFKTIREVASQIAGRKQRRKTQFNFRIPRHMQRRQRQSPFKDIADAHSARQLQQWIKEDGHSPDVDGGSLSNAFRETVATLHHVHRRDLKEFKKGGSISGLGLSDAQHYLKRGHEVLENIAGTTLTQADVLGDHALSTIGLRSKRYTKLERTKQNQLHARLAQEVYKSDASRGEVDGWGYVEGNDRYGVWGKGNQRIVHWRGTRPDANIIASGDAKADVQIALGESESFDELSGDKALVKALLDKGHDVSIGGYSLAGGVALQVMNDDSIYKRLGDNNHVISPGITAMNPHLKKLANLDKVSYTYHALDPVASALLPHANDNHHVEKTLRDPVSAHTTFLKDLAG